MQLENRLENNPLKQLKRDHLINTIATGFSAACGISLLIYGLFSKDTKIVKISNYICSGAIFALVAFEYFSICRPTAEIIRNCENNLRHNIYLR